MLQLLRNLFQGLLGGASYAADPLQTGATYIKEELKKLGISRTYSEELLLELSRCAIKFSETMYQMSQKDEKVTYYVNHLDYIVSLLQQAETEGGTTAPEPIRSVLLTHGIKAEALC